MPIYKVQCRACGNIIEVRSRKKDIDVGELVSIRCPCNGQWNIGKVVEKRQKSGKGGRCGGENV